MISILIYFLIGSILAIASILIGVILVLILLKKLRIPKRKKDTD